MEAEMLKIDLGHTIIEMVELTLERGDREHALVVPIQIDGDGRRICFAYFFFWRGSSYTTVGSKMTNELPLNFLSTEPNEWKLESHHDSCWRSDGVNSTLSGISSTIRKLTPKIVDIEVRFYQSPRKVKVESVTRTDHSVQVVYKN